VLLAGCGSGGDQTNSATSTESPTLSDGTRSVTAADVTATSGEDWQVTHVGFDPEPTAVREFYPPELVWDPAVESTTGTLTVAVADDASAGEYEFPVEVRSEDEAESAVATARSRSKGSVNANSPRASR